MARRLAQLRTDEALARLVAARVPAAPVHGVLGALATPYLQAQGLVADVPTEEGTYRVVQDPLRSGVAPRPAPALGEHTAEVLRSWTEGEAGGQAGEVLGAPILDA